MRALLTALTLIVPLGLGALGVSPNRDPHALQDKNDAGYDAKPDAGTPRYDVPACILVRTYARYGAGAYDHFVEIDSACKKTAHCEVSTDVNPEPIAVDVPAGESREVLTYRGSPAYEFSAKVRCKLESKPK